MGADYLEYSFNILYQQTFKDFDIVISDNSYDDSIKNVWIGEEDGAVGNFKEDGYVVRGENKNYKFVCEYNGDTALRDGRVCGKWWTRGNSWCGGSKVKYSCMNTTSLKKKLY